MKRKNWRFRGNELKYLRQVLNDGFKAGADGAFSTKFERAVAETYDVKHAISMNSGTGTLHAALLALGIGPGDEVLVPALTPLMCGLAIHYTGATPVYVDVEFDTFLMDPIDTRTKISAKTKAIMVVHMYGNICNLPAFIELANEMNLSIVEDCAQCHYGRTPSGQYAGTFGDFGSWSFENSKHLTSGDGGVLVTNSSELAQKARKIGGLGFKTLTADAGRVRTNRDLLQNPNWERFDTIGYNYRLTQLAAAVALAQIERREKFMRLRKKSGAAYAEKVGSSNLFVPQRSYKGFENTYYTFSARFRGVEFGISWEEFRKKYIFFGGDGIYAASKLLYQEPVFRENEIGRETCPVAESLQQELMNFTTNQKNLSEIRCQMNALEKTLKHFGNL